MDFFHVNSRSSDRLFSSSAFIALFSPNAHHFVPKSCTVIAIVASNLSENATLLYHTFSIAFLLVPLTLHLPDPRTSFFGRAGTGYISRCRQRHSLHEEGLCPSTDEHSYCQRDLSQSPALRPAPTRQGNATWVEPACQCANHLDQIKLVMVRFNPADAERIKEKYLSVDLTFIKHLSVNLHPKTGEGRPWIGKISRHCRKCSQQDM